MANKGGPTIENPPKANACTPARESVKSKDRHPN
jgi:hypothetical protein